MAAHFYFKLIRANQSVQSKENRKRHCEKTTIDIELNLTNSPDDLLIFSYASEKLAESITYVNFTGKGPRINP